MVHISEQAEGLADTLHGDRRPILLSVYFDAGKSIAQGRKVAAKLASANPILKDVAEVLTILRIPWQYEARALSRGCCCGHAGRRVRAAGACAEALGPPARRRTRRTRATRRLSAAACASCCARRRTCRTIPTCLTVRARSWATPRRGVRP